MLLTITYSESAYPISLVERLKLHFWDNSEICLLFSRKQQKYLSHVVDITKFVISIPDFPSRKVETTFLGQF